MQTLGIDNGRLGGGLVLFGLLGVVLAGIVAVALVVGGLSVRSIGDEVEDDRLALVEALERMAASVGNAAEAADNVEATLESTGAVVGDTKGTLDDLAASVDSLVTALGFEILGQRPLAGAAESFAGLSDSLKSFAGHLDDITTDLKANQQDLAEIASDLRGLQGRVDALAARVEGFDRVDELIAAATWGLALCGAMAAWVAAAGGLIAWVGWQLRRPTAR